MKFFKYILLGFILINLISLESWIAHAQEIEIFKSSFHKMTLEFKKSKKELVSPSYSPTFILISHDAIGIYIDHEEIEDEYATLTEPRIINEPSQDNDIIYYTHEGHIVTIKNQTIKWSYSDEKASTEWEFQDIQTGNAEELNKYTNLFGFNPPERKTLSINMVGLSKKEILFKYSEAYYPPEVKDKTSLMNNIGAEKILIFNPNEKFKNAQKHKSVIFLDKDDICISMTLIYEGAYKNPLTEIFNEALVGVSEDSWIEETSERVYNYSILDFKDLFGILIK